ncbi:hypothetical protein BJ912DRAFT_972669 [Pholiota molesta]|nr:hypothetical protein BJ912DRAFT_972669 [Pholiota molesta]
MIPERSTIKPMNKVPYDVLREIFIHCLPLHPLRDRQSHSKKIAPLLLFHICSSWRTVALTSAGYGLSYGPKSNLFDGGGRIKAR